MKSLGDRMKESYELRQRHYLTSRTPVIVRMDGRAFHTYTRGFAQPFDSQFMVAMVSAASYSRDRLSGIKLCNSYSDHMRTCCIGP